MKHLYLFWGKVREGEKRGKKLGFPTANINLKSKIPEGIYASTVKIDKKIYEAATFIGSAKTFGEKEYKAESYILDFNQNIYKEWLSIKLFKKLRNNKKFASKNELIKQIKQDILAVRKFLGKLG